MIRITKDDLRLFEYLEENQFVERNFIKESIWEHKNNSYIDNRLSQLIKANYINKTSHPDKRRERLLTNTPKSSKYLKYSFKKDYMN